MTEWFIVIRESISCEIKQIIGPYNSEFLAERDSEHVMGDGFNGYFCETISEEDLLLEKAPERTLN